MTGQNCFSLLATNKYFNINLYRQSNKSTKTKKTPLKQILKTSFYFFHPTFAVRTGLEPATPCVTGMYSNQLNYRTFPQLRCKGRNISLNSNEILLFFKETFYKASKNSLTAVGNKESD